MSIDQVIEAGNGVSMGHDNSIIVITIVLIGLSFLFLVASFFTGVVELLALSGICFVCGMVFMMVASLPFPTNKTLREYEMAEKAWEETYVLPYMKTLPEQKMDIIYVKVDLDMEQEDMQTNVIGDASRTPLIVGYKDSEGMKTAKGMMETSFTLPDGETPYITYKAIPANLGHEIKAGMSNVILHLPKSYTFTDMK